MSNKFEVRNPKFENLSRFVGINSNIESPKLENVKLPAIVYAVKKMLG